MINQVTECFGYTNIYIHIYTLIHTLLEKKVLSGSAVKREEKGLFPQTSHLVCVLNKGLLKNEICFEGFTGNSSTESKNKGD